MWLFLWDSEPSKIFVGDTSISKVFLWDTKVRPSRLPSEYQEVEYIQSSWSWNSWQYIDTGFVPDPYYFKLYLDFKSRINYWASNINGRPQYNFASYMNYDMYEIFFWTSISPHIRYGITQWVRYKYTLEANNWTATLTDEDWTVLQTITYSWTLQATWAYNFWIFRRQEQPQYTDYSDGTLYACKMYTTNDVLVRDFVPCYRKSDWEIWLYDLVNNQFYANSWTWAFTKWPDVS